MQAEYEEAYYEIPPRIEHRLTDKDIPW